MEYKNIDEKKTEIIQWYNQVGQNAPTNNGNYTEMILTFDNLKIISSNLRNKCKWVQVQVDTKYRICSRMGKYMNKKRPEHIHLKMCIKICLIRCFVVCTQLQPACVVSTNRKDGPCASILYKYTKVKPKNNQLCNIALIFWETNEQLMEPMYWYFTHSTT